MTGAADPEAAGNGRDSCAVRLPSADSLTAARRMEDQRQTRVTTLDEENLKVRSTERKKIARRQRVPQTQAAGLNQCSRSPTRPQRA